MLFGRVSLENGSAIIEGVNTEFTKELENGDFVVVRVGGITYTLPVLSVESDTRMTAVREFPGPSEAELAWKIIPRETQNRVSAEMMSQATEALRILNIDKRNWQSVFSSDGDIAVTLRDGTVISGPSWKKLVSSTNRVDQQYTTETRLWNDADRNNFRLTLQNDGNWGVYSEKSGTWRPLDIYQGGTGATSLNAARINFQIDRVSQGQSFTSLSAPANPDGTVNFIDIRSDNNTWGAYISGVGPIPLGLANGGTGVSSLFELEEVLGLKWLPSTDPKVLEYIDWLGVGMSPSETMVRIGVRSIEIQGIIRSTSNIPFRIKKGLPSLPNFRMPYSPAMYADPNGNMGICYLRAVAGSATNFDFVVDGTQTLVAWYMINCTIRFIAAGEN